MGSGMGRRFFAALKAANGGSTRRSGGFVCGPAVCRRCFRRARAGFVIGVGVGGACAGPVIGVGVGGACAGSVIGVGAGGACAGPVIGIGAGGACAGSVVGIGAGGVCTGLGIAVRAVIEAASGIAGLLPRRSPALLFGVGGGYDIFYYEKHAYRGKCA